jgi:alkanesulfonate monooxygenase SsuD/methylene tetrahydromethanopterin reductase-like flavin-dependent oxidoreductase (luciferase family)
MRFGNFLFSESRDPLQDGRVIDEVLEEVRLSDSLGMDAVWLAEHHFDGSCAYVDPISFAAAIATSTKRIGIGFAVAQMSLHHPIRMAEQLSLIDHLSKGRLLVGLGRGTAFNVYEYHGYGIDPAEVQARFEEAEAILFKAWSGEGFEHHGRFWNLKVPMLRPRPYTRPHPYVINAASGEATMVELARQGRPFLMNLQSNEVTAHRLDLYRRTMREAGFGEPEIARNLAECWIWRNVFVADTDAEAERIGIPALEAMQDHRAAMRERMRREQGLAMPPGHGPAVPAGRTGPRHALIHGSPATVAAQFAEIDALGVGGVIMSFRLGLMSQEQTIRSLTLFAEQVAPLFRARQAA